MPNISNGLTEKMKHFVREYYNNGGNATMAYMTAYNSNSERSASIEGSKLLQRDDIQEYLNTLNKPAENKAISERQKKRDILWEELENARTQQDHNAVARYMDILNKMDSEYINTTRIESDNKTAISALDTNTLQQLIKPKNNE